ncbi:hypothetical protein J6590_054269 [Homalodisca vitripennis]|nr:hypothetical protein J6590_054269 [Homalodisca vitripennis]
MKGPRMHRFRNERIFRILRFGCMGLLPSTSLEGKTVCVTSHWEEWRMPEDDLRMEGNWRIT